VVVLMIANSECTKVSMCNCS